MKPTLTRYALEDFIERATARLEELRPTKPKPNRFHKLPPDERKAAVRAARQKGAAVRNARHKEAVSEFMRKASQCFHIGSGHEGQVNLAVGDKANEEQIEAEMLLALIRLCHRTLTTAPPSETALPSQVLRSVRRGSRAEFGITYWQ